MPTNNEGWVDVQQSDDGWVDANEYENMPWSEVFSRASKRKAWTHTPEQQAEFERDARFPSPMTAVVDPLIGVGKTVVGGVEKLFGLPPVGDEQESFNQLQQHFGQYFTPGGAKKMIAEKPGQVLVDAGSIVLPMKAGAKTLARPGPKIKTASELKAAGGAGLNVARNSGVYFTSDFVQPFSKTLVESAVQGGVQTGEGRNQRS